MSTVTLQDAMLAVMNTAPRRDWTVQQVVAAVDYAEVFTPSGRSAQATLSHRVRIELSKLGHSGSVIRVRRDTHRLP